MKFVVKTMCRQQYPPSTPLAAFARQIAANITYRLLDDNMSMHSFEMQSGFCAQAALVNISCSLQVQAIVLGNNALNGSLPSSWASLSEVRVSLQAELSMLPELEHFSHFIGKILCHSHLRKKTPLLDLT